MTMSADEAFNDAVRRADLGALSGPSDTGVCTPAALGRLIRHGDPEVRRRGLVLLAERVRSGPALGAHVGAEYAALLPGSVSVVGAGAPETALVLAGLYERLGPFLGGRSWPRWRTAGLPVRVRIAWLRAELLNDPSVIRDEPPGELLYQAVRDVDVTEAHRPAEFVDALVDSGDPALWLQALRLARQGLRAGLLAPVRVRAVVSGLLGGGGAVTEAALAELTESWAALDPLPPGRLAPFLAVGPVSARPKVAEAALAVAAHHGHGDLVRQVAGDPDLPPGLRRRALELLGDLAVRGDIGDLTALAVRDPLLFGAALVTCLRGLHRRGHFAEAGHVPSLVALALADHTVPPVEVATILFTCREVLFRVLVDAEPGDPSWPRRLALLVALAGQGTGELPIGAAITRVLPVAPAPRPFLDAIRVIRHVDAEEAVIALLPSAPAAALEALEAIGGHRTVRALRDGLGLGAPESEGAPEGEGAPASGGAPENKGAPEGEGAPAADIAPHLRAVRTRALELLWHLTGEAGGAGNAAQRRALLVRLDPADLPPRIAADLGGPDEQELALLGAHMDPGNPVAALCRLAAHGSAGPLPVIAGLLARVVTELAASRVPGAAAPGTRGEPPVREPAVPQEVVDALHALGRRLHERRKIRPSCLLDAKDAQSAGHALVATTALDLLERPGLSDSEQAILLELLLRAPYFRTRARVHRMLRHRDRHVRKHVIALLARDTGGDDAQALSATLIALTTAGDVQTVRQSLLALGHAGARWACSAVAACLDHPNMNIKKTAAAVLVRIGTPAAVPKLLLWLGRHDNPGLHSTIAEALRTVLGTAYAATLVAAAERGDSPRTVGLLLEALSGELSARSVRALDDQASPVAPALLALVANGRVTLTEGTAEDLAAPLARHGITPPTGYRPTGGDGSDRPDPDVTSPATEGWHPSIALRVAQRAKPPLPDRLWTLRPLLPDWLRLAGAEPSARQRLVRFAMRLCPAPWTDAELTAFAQFAQVLTDALREASDQDRQDLVAVLAAAAPKLTAARRPAVADAVRSLPPGPAGPTSTLTLLRRLDAVLVRADLEQALAAARLGGAPWPAEAAVLREAFGVDKPSAHSVPAEVRAWRAALDAAVRTPNALAAFRRAQDGTAGSRDRLAALVEAYSPAAPEVRTALIDWMTVLQPLDAPPWTLTEAARPPAPPTPRTLRIDDLDQPRSTALRERLLTMLRGPAPDRRETAALALLTWPEPAATVPVLRAFLQGRIDLPAGAGPVLARTLAVMGEAELRADGILRSRVAAVAAKLDPCDLEPLIPLLLEWWEDGPPATTSAAADALLHVPADVLATHLGDQLTDGSWGYLDLLVGRPLLRTSALTTTCRRLRAEGRDHLADRLRPVDGPLLGPHAAPQARTTPAEDTHRPSPPSPPSPPELLRLARTGTPEQVRRALTQLTEADRAQVPVPELRTLIGELLHHAKPGVRLHAHRTSRVTMDRPTHLGHTSVLLEDPQPSIVRTAVHTLCHAAWAPAIPALAALLEHPHPVVRTAATEGLLTLGAPTVPALRHAADHARPDKRSVYTDVLQQIRSTQE
ncbi:HEAT repeat domain-containing protein [Streptomyces finlayi]|uniref:HEAT repeat domain-containing protein n=1 Tax=Streptomyces finlayi TaxID=67296 RepID=A0A7G7BM09_9ACTN|nr:HEAT repeat domain-containing protein [Streptomyces finlayi]QNE76374.1 HEAT repeat domain-containing protein [Streptomyces finlayi]